MIVAAIDIGTNSVRLLVTDAQGKQLERQMQITRLGQDVDKTGALAPEAVERTAAVLEEYAAIIRERRATSVRITATSAARDASNRGAFFARVRSILGHEPELLSGDEEAKLSFAGATAELDTSQGPFMIFDIGGGSTEFAFGTEQPQSFISVDMGGVRVTERFLATDPPTGDEMQAAQRFVTRQLERVSTTLPCTRARQWIGLAGTVTSCAAHALRLVEYDPKETHGHELSAAQTQEFLTALASVPVAERRRLLVEPKRAEVIVGGAIVLHAIFEHFRLSTVRVSEQDILDGLAASLR